MRPSDTPTPDPSAPPSPDAPRGVHARQDETPADMAERSVPVPGFRKFRRVDDDAEGVDLIACEHRGYLALIARPARLLMSAADAIAIGRALVEMGEAMARKDPP